jgi:hypothetical protein
MHIVRSRRVQLSDDPEIDREGRCMTMGWGSEFEGRGGEVQSPPCLVVHARALGLIWFHGVAVLVSPVWCSR